MTIVKKTAACKNKRSFRKCWDHFESNCLNPQTCVFQNVAISEGPWRVREGKREGVCEVWKKMKKTCSPWRSVKGTWRETWRWKHELQTFAVREGPWRVREEKREANVHVSDVVSCWFLSLMLLLEHFLDISRVRIACSSYVKEKVG